MAANLQRRGFVTIGKRFIKQNWISSSRDPSPATLLPVSTDRRGAHFYVYDKNPDDQLLTSVVHDDVIEPQSEKYWAPHPKTGVFGPPDHNGSAGGDHLTQPLPPDGSVMELTAWFRPLEDVDKPQQY
ncbi:late embryogenesis abundant protein At5g17165-like [Tasmannia lanceolata]|uniref:late embryogenesis abundant protein At5g17165-like n=1 Tax=Tasmannia lanceolata TaxID=3420 RepID=UPI0040635912